MKLRLDYVSNSSSSSFLISYDKTFFGDITEFLNQNEIGCETEVKDIDSFFDYIDDKEEYHQLKNKVEKAKADGKDVVYFFLDDTCAFMIDMLKMINEKNGGKKLEIIHGDY